MPRPGVGLVRRVAIGGLALSLAACAPPPRPRAPLFARVEAERTGGAVQSVAALPEVAEADELSREAAKRDDAGDPVAAELLLERARAKLATAVAKGRQRDASERLRAAKEGLAVATRERETLVAGADDESKAIDEAVAKLGAARAKLRAAALEPVSGARDKARRLAAEATLLDAAETCAFARVVGLRGPGVDRAAAVLHAAEKQAGSGTDALEAASRARNACLALHAPETARQAERRVTELDRAIVVAASMGLEATRDAIGLTFNVEGEGAELDALAAFVRAYGGVALVVDRRSDPGLPVDLQSTAIAKALGNAEGVLQLAPRLPLVAESKRRLVVRVAPRWPGQPAEASSVAGEP